MRTLSEDMKAPYYKRVKGIHEKNKKTLIGFGVGANEKRGPFKTDRSMGKKAKSAPPGAAGGGSLEEEQEPQSGETIALFPGSFKPPHKGHLAVVDALSKMGANKVIVLISAPKVKARSDISAEQVKEVFEIYANSADFNADVDFIVSPMPSPISAAYDFLEKNQFPLNSKVILATSTADSGRFPQDKLEKYAAKNPTNPSVSSEEIEQVIGDDGEKKVSATDMRAILEDPSADVSLLKKFMPDKLLNAEKQKVIDILTTKHSIEPTLQESLASRMFRELLSELIGKPTSDDAESLPIPQKSFQEIADLLKGKGYEVIAKPPSRIVVKSEDRQVTKDALEKELEAMNFSFVTPAPGSGFGRFELIQSGGNVYIYLKPTKGGAADAGVKHEGETVEAMQKLFPDLEIKNAEFGAGSDLEMKKGDKRLSIELKTSSGADFGQFKLVYDTKSKVWATAKTKNFLDNEALFQGVFDGMIAPFLKGKDITSFVGDPAVNVNSDGTIILGLRRSPNTSAIKLEMQKVIFAGRADFTTPIASDLIQNYYAKKGDSLVSIKGKGLYALTSEAAALFSVPELKDEITVAGVRFRIKSHSGANSEHSFTCALKVIIKSSPVKITDQAFLDKVKNYFQQ